MHQSAHESINMISRTVPPIASPPGRLGRTHGTIARFLVLGSLAAVLAGCVQPTSAVAPAVDSGVGPGSASVDEMDASMIFSKVCGDTAPSFRKAPSVMKGMAFRQRPETGTYYHQNLDLSIKLFPKRCSMVFGSKSDPLQLGLMLAAAAGVNSGSNEVSVDPDSGASATKGPKGTSFRFEPGPLHDQYPMYRAVLIAP